MGNRCYEIRRARHAVSTVTTADASTTVAADPASASAGTARNGGTGAVVDAAGLRYPGDEDVLTEKIQTWMNEAAAIAAGVGGGGDDDNNNKNNNPYDEEFDADEVLLQQQSLRALLVPSYYSCCSERDVADERATNTTFTAVGATTTSSPPVATSSIFDTIGPSLAAGYRYLNPLTLRGVRTVVLLHSPSSPSRRKKSAVTGADLLETPLGNLRVDTDLRDELFRVTTPPPPSSSQRNPGFFFDILPKQVEEAEATAELHFPFLAHCLRTSNLLDQVRVLPIMIGEMKTSDEIAVGLALRRVFASRDVLVVLSTNLCHWGEPFRYRPVASVHNKWQENVSVEQVVSQLDRYVVSI